MFGHDRLQRQGHHRSDLRRIGHDVLGEMWVALLGHGAATDGAGGDRFFDLAEFLLHAGIDLVGKFAAGRRQESQQHHMLCQVIHDAARWYRHRRHVEMGGHPSLYLQTLVTEGGDRAGGAA